MDNPEAYQHKLDETAKYLSKEDRVLEFGCGTGTTALIHAPRVSHIDAIDFSSEMIAIAREKAEAQAIKNVRFEVSSFEDWPIPNPDGDYDAVLAMSILHLVSNLDETLSKVHRALKPDGLFFSSTVCIGRMNPIHSVRSVGPRRDWHPAEDTAIDTGRPDRTHPCTWLCHRDGLAA